MVCDTIALFKTNYALQILLEVGLLFNESFKMVKICFSKKKKEKKDTG